MSTGWGALALLTLLVPLAAVVMDGDRWLVGPAGLSGDAGGLIGLAEGAPTSAAGLVPPPLPSPATAVAADDVAAAARTGLTSTDRAPPGPTPPLA
jgi:hypothetical protein